MRKCTPNLNYKRPYPPRFLLKRTYDFISVLLNCLRTIMRSHHSQRKSTIVPTSYPNNGNWLKKIAVGKYAKMHSRICGAIKCRSAAWKFKDERHAAPSINEKQFHGLPQNIRTFRINWRKHGANLFLQSFPRDWVLLGASIKKSVELHERRFAITAHSEGSKYSKGVKWWGDTPQCTDPKAKLFQLECSNDSSTHTRILWAAKARQSPTRGKSRREQGYVKSFP